LTEPAFKDHFSGHAGSYAAHRPSYPESMFAFLASSCVDHELAWDCATGNGQAARLLTPFFDRVIATDGSEQQIASAEQHPKIEFRVALAETSGIDAGSVDLITVGQALHWFDIDAFFAGACRILKSGGVLAVWSYERCLIGAECNEVIEKVFAEVEDYWPSERDIVDGHYSSITMPLPEIPVDAFEMQLDWTAVEMLAYMRTWSASRRYIQANRSDPVALYEQELQQKWGAGKRDLRWPLTIKVCRKPA
jgi:SAM-dependent methyltransferase